MESSPVYLLVVAVEFFDKIAKIDDPVGAISVHGICGAFGTLMVGFFSSNQGLLFGHGGALLKSQFIGVVSIAAWALACSAVLFLALKKFNGLRVEKIIEEEGLDIYEHGESAYNLYIFINSFNKPKLSVGDPRKGRYLFLCIPQKVEQCPRPVSTFIHVIIYCYYSSSFSE